jgi:hypothetical protein
MDEKPDNYVLDATMGWPPVFCPLEGDIHGEFSIITGLNFVESMPRGGKVVAIVHESGQDAVIAFCERYATELAELLPAMTAPRAADWEPPANG